MSDLKQKPFDIPKRLVWEAYRKVAANKGAAGVDGQSITEFEEDLKGNLFKLWNRLSSGSYFPPPVRGVEIPKSSGGTRMLGVPTVADRIAQTVVCMVLEPAAEPVFHPDSYGYRPGRSALHAVARARRRCWENDWVIDMDIRAFFDTVPWDLVLRAVKHHSREPWVLLYVKRWLEAPLQLPDGTISERTMGTPQGSAISPLLANLFMHYAFDAWMARDERFDVVGVGGAGGGRDAVLVTESDVVPWAVGCACLAVTAGIGVCAVPVRGELALPGAALRVRWAGLL